MNEEIKKVLEHSVRVLKSKGGMANEEVKSVVISMEKLIKIRRPQRRVKRA